MIFNAQDRVPGDRLFFSTITHYRTDSCECGVYWRTRDEGFVVEIGHYRRSVDRRSLSYNPSQDDLDFTQGKAYHVSEIVWFLKSFFWNYLIRAGLRRSLWQALTAARSQDYSHSHSHNEVHNEGQEEDV